MNHDRGGEYSSDVTTFFKFIVGKGINVQQNFSEHQISAINVCLIEENGK